MSTLLAAGKAEALALGLGQLVGQTPMVDSSGPVAKVYWTKEQIPAVKTWVDNQMSKQGDVEIDFLPVALSYALPKVLPWAIGAVILIYILGKSSR
jgi:hypothetical protein